MVRGDRERLDVLERGNRALRRANGSLLTTLANVVRLLAPAPPASSPAGARGRTNEFAQWRAAVKGDAPGETVLVPRGASR